MPHRSQREEGHLEDRMTRLRSLCRQRGLSLTHQRLAVLKAVMESGGHPTAEEVFQGLRPAHPALSRATVYKALSVLSDLGLIAKRPPPGVARTAALFDAHLGRHHHALCRSCGAVTDVEDSPRLRPRLPRSSGFIVEDYTINFYGTCRRCAGAATTQRGDPE